MRRLSSHWLFSLLMVFVLAIATPVAAGGHHGNASCLDSLALQGQVVAWDISELAEPKESDPSSVSPCCMPCAYCGASMVRLTDGAAAASIPLSGHGMGNPLGPPAPFERPPRV